MTAPAASTGTSAPATIEGRSPWQIVRRKLRRNRVAMWSLGILAFLYFVAVFGGFFAPYRYDHQFRDSPYAAPHVLGGIHLWDAAGDFHWRPFVYGKTRQRTTDKFGEPILRVVDDPARRHPVRFFVQGDEWRLLGLFPCRWHLFGVDPLAVGAAAQAAGAPAKDAPGVIYLLGSDNFGRDIFSRLVYGSLVSMTVGLVGITISLSLGLLLGGIAGYVGGPVEFALMRLTEVIMAVPAIYLILTLRQVFPRDISSIASYFLIVAILALIGWASSARVIRGLVLSLREQDYVAAARALGVGHLAIIVRHILPNTLSYVIVSATLAVPYYILGEVTLSFLGVGIQEPEASWGLMLKDAQHSTELVQYPWLIAPGVMVFIAVLAYNVFGDGLRDAADPRSVLEARKA